MAAEATEVLFTAGSVSCPQLQVKLLKPDDQSAPSKYVLKSKSLQVRHDQRVKPVSRFHQRVK